MTIDLHRLDGIEDYDEAMEALDDYVGDLMDEFLDAPEGQAYLTQYPEMEEAVGSWVYQLLCFSYEYCSERLPQLQKTDVETVLTQLFPRKLTLLAPEEANTTIPELIAFWEFLKRQYKHPNAAKILTFLKQLQPKFPSLMNDSSNFGFAKSFFTAGMNAGYDMTTEAGMQAFQQQYNQSLQAARAAGTPPPAEFQQLFNQITSAAGSFLSDDVFLEHLTSNSPALDQAPLDSDRGMDSLEELPPLPDEITALLHQQTISTTEPGSILKDFQILLEAIGDGIPVSSTHHLLPQALLVELNQQLSQPILLDLKRPVQKSFPSLNGMYLLLRTLGLGYITSKGKKQFLVLHPEILQSWRQLNPTEQYFSLLEAWLLRASDEILGERSGPLSEGSKCIRFWAWMKDKGQKFKDYGEQQSLNYYPSLHNLALMQQFGFLKVESGKPEAGKGWRIKQVKRLPLGDALMQIVTRASIAQDMVWESETNPLLPFGELQPFLQPYFPEWQRNLTLPQPEFHSGLHVFKVSLGKIWRRIVISADETLYSLACLILESVDFDNDHLHLFTYRNQVGRTVEVGHPETESERFTDEVLIGELPLEEGQTLTYVFDFGDWWEFEVKLEKIQPEDTRSEYAEILEAYGEAPPQYPNWDEEDWEEEDEDEDEDEKEN